MWKSVLKTCQSGCALLFWKLILVARISNFDTFVVTMHHFHFYSSLTLLLYPLPTMVYTSPTKRACIIHLKATGLSDEQIVTIFNIHQSTVYHIYHRHTQTNNYYHVKPKPGCLHKFTTRDVCVAARMLANAEAHDIANLQRLRFPHMTAETIWKRLAKCGLKAYIHHKKPHLSLEKKEKHLEWAKAHKHWTVENWKSIIFFDESKFNIFVSDGCRYCWRKPGQEFDKQYV